MTPNSKKPHTGLEHDSALETLLIRKKYEANYKITPNISYCKYLQSVYRNICETTTHEGPRVCVITCVFESESKKVDRVMLFSTDLSEALLEDLMRNELSKVFTRVTVGDKVLYGFYQKNQLFEKKMRELQKERYHPARVIETACVQKKIFDTFVIVAITGIKLPYQEIKNAIEQYRKTVHQKAKLIIVGVDHLKPNSVFSKENNCLLVSGVNKGTTGLLWDFMGT